MVRGRQTAKGWSAVRVAQRLTSRRSSEIVAWVRGDFRPTTVSDRTVYDLTQPMA